MQSIDVRPTGPLTLSVLHHVPSGNAIVRVTPPVDASHLNPEHLSVLPLDVICVIDVSGSMGDSATVQDEAGKSESHGLTILDVVKHATATIGAMLRPQDRLSVVTFSCNAQVEMPLSQMNDAGKDCLKATLARLQPNGSTNLWAGLKNAMDLVGGGSNGRTTSVLLLTDGQPDEPKGGHIPLLDQYISQFQAGCVPFSVSTVGFGYNLNSELLRTIADKTGGMYVFIPDSGLVGTVFLNLIANVQVTAAIGLTLKVALPEGFPVATLRAHPLLKPAVSSFTGSVGTVQFGQTRDLLVSAPGLTSSDLHQLTAQLQYCFQGVWYTTTAAAVEAESPSEIDAIRDAVAAESFLRCASSMEKTKAVSAFLTGLGTLQPHTAFMQALKKDVEGQIAMSFEGNNFHKWGKHFLPSIVCANLRQQCNNFKDFSVQLFGGSVFSKIRDAGEAVFLKLPPPKPSAAARGYNGTHGAAPMTSYYNVSGGCVTADSLVSTKGGQTTCASNVTRGTILSNGATVRCVVRIRTQPSGVTVVRFPWTGLAITAYHPIRDPSTKQWTFPCFATGALSALELNHEFVYTFLLDGGNCVSINDVDVVALGHGLTDNDVVSHEYLGTQRVVEDIEACNGFSTGVVTIDDFARDAKSQRITGVLQLGLQSRVAAAP